MSHLRKKIQRYCSALENMHAVYFDGRVTIFKLFFNFHAILNYDQDRANNQLLRSR